MKNTNILYYGDNLRVLREHVADESVDLVYLDPPFNSNADYNVLFEDQDGTRAAAQIQAFGDTWRWDQSAAGSYQEVVEAGGKVSQVMQAFRTFLGENDMLAYLSMMAPRLIELRRVLKETGSIYLHCDPTASHYLKLLMDAVFGPENFRNEIIWQRTAAKGLMTRKLPDNHDIILSFQKTCEPFWNADAIYTAYDADDLDEKTAEKYALTDPDGRRYQLTSLLNPNPDRPNLTYEFLGVTRVWRWTKDRMEAAYKAGQVVQPKPGGVPRFKRYLDEQRGKPLHDVWIDIPPLNSQAAERLGYPTQKPEALLERIIRMSCPEHGVVLDPFCGCGTAIAAAQKLDRHWVGIDLTHLAISLIKHRLFAAFGTGIDKKYKIIGEPEDVSGAQQLAHDDPYQFQWWALSLVHARPVEQKKGADKGIDGRLYFVEGSNKTRQVIFSVKAGHTGVAHVRDLRGVIEREKADIGVLITMETPTQPMKAEAASAGFFTTGFDKAQFPRLQILTVAELLGGKRVDLPPWHQQKTFKEAKRVKGKDQMPQAKMFED